MNDEVLTQMIVDSMRWNDNLTIWVAVQEKINPTSIINRMDGEKFVQIAEESGENVASLVTRLYKEKDLKERVEERAVLEYI